jgi:hypothetical protein
MRDVEQADELERPLPHSVDAERSVLGAVLLENNKLVVATQILGTQDFFLLRHRHIFEHMIQLYLSHLPIDTITLMNALKRSGQLEAAGGVPYLSELPSGVPHVNNIDYYARIVKEKSSLRMLIYSAAAIQEEALEGAEDARVILSRAIETISRISGSGRPNWLELFDTPEEIENSPPLTFAVQGFLQCGAATLLAGLSGHYKTWLMLSVAKAALDERIDKLWGTFTVIHRPSRVIYLVPESARGPLRYRLEVLGLLPYIRSQKLLVRTLNKGAAPLLQDTRLLAAAKGADIFLDTAVRFMQGDENSAGDNARGLASDVFALLSADARTVFAAAHSPKAFETQNYMSLENMVRGSGDIAAAFATVWGVRRLPGDIAHIQNIKPRDFEPCGPFQLCARPHISKSGDFAMLKPPGESGVLSAEMLANSKNRGGGAPEVAREARVANLARIRGWLRDDPNLTSMELSQRFAVEGIKVGDSAIRKYRKDLNL